MTRTLRPGVFGETGGGLRRTWLVAVAAVAAAGCTPADSGGLDCPGGTAPFRATSAAGSEDWCQLADGVVHGPYEERDASDGLLVRGAFDHGLADGVWHRFAPETHAPLADEGYDRARPNGRWVVWAADGELASEHFWAFGTPCGRWSEREGGVEVSHQDFVDCADVDAPPEPVDGPPLAVVGDFGWDGAACPSGTTLVTAPPDDPNARYCVRAGGDVRHGPFGRWYAGDATTKASGGDYADGAPTGTWRTWHPGGTVSAEGARDAAGRTGTWRFWRADRSLESTGAYAADLRTGAWTWYWPHGTEQAAGSYHDGAEDGVWNTFYPTGIPDATLTYQAGVLDGAYAQNHPSGVHAAAGQYLDGHQSGTWTSWHDNGVEASRGDYAAGLRTGVWRTWSRASLPESEGPFEVGIQHGTWTLWSWQQGERIKSTGDVVGSQPHGLWQATHDPGGEPAGEVTYYFGSREGPSTTIWKSGHTLSEGSYLANQPHGAWRFYYPDGQLFIDCTFGFGERDGDYREYYPDGAPKAEGVYQDGYKIGLWTYWDEDGDMRTEGSDE